MLIFPEVEPNYPANLGISDSVGVLLPFLQSHPTIGAADLVQFAGAVALTNCPGAPQVQFLAGRKDATEPAPEGLIPEPQDSVDSILARFDDAGGMTPFEVIALLASHSVARADKVDLTIDAAPFDSVSILPAAAHAHADTPRRRPSSSTHKSSSRCCSRASASRGTTAP